MPSEKKTAASTPSTANAAPSGSKFYLVQQGKEMFVLTSSEHPDLSVEPGEKLKKVICAHERRDIIDRVVARQEAEAGLKLRQ
jgi:hypothetical protein